MATVSSTQNSSYDYSALNAKASTTKTDMEEQQDRFMKLLVTQLQNQDPLNPMDCAETTSQMAQINMVTQLSQLNDSFTSMLSSFTAQQTLQAANVIGKSVLAAGSTLNYDGSTAIDFRTNITSGLKGGLVQVVDASGKVVQELEFGQQSFTGYGNFTWDGKTAEGTTAPAGTYTIRAYGAQSDGSAVQLQTQTWQKVGSVALDGGSTKIVLADGSAVDLNSVSQIR